jgi:hypothetical protein
VHPAVKVKPKVVADPLSHLDELENCPTIGRQDWTDCETREKSEISKVYTLFLFRERMR